MNLLELEKEVIKAAKHVGDMMLHADDFEIKEKNNDSGNIVTNVDVEVQEYLIKTLKELLPESSFYAEENNKRDMNDGYVWIIDPIDGTMNFAYGFNMSATSIGLIYQNKPILGVVYDPYYDEVFHATLGNGAYCNDTPIEVKHNDMRHSLMICGTSPYARHLADRTFDVMKRLFLASKDVRRTGSAVLDLCHLAAGRADGFFECQLAPWDYCAGSFIVKEAKGIVETLLPYTWGYTKSISIIAGNENNIDAIREIVTK